jgi:hypothetical protein
MDYRMLDPSEKQELEQLRKSAHAFINCPLEKAFFHLEALMDKPSKNPDSIMSANSFFVLARAVIELKNRIVNK